MNTRYHYHPLDNRVLAVAVINEEHCHGDWTAYIGAVPGHDHTAEAKEVAAHGTKLPEPMAGVVFPMLARLFKWRD